MKKIVYLLACLAAMQTATAQKPGFFSGGVSLLCGWDKNSENTTILPSITLSPGIKFIQKGDFTVMAQVPLSFGLSFQNDENSKLITYAGLDLPLTCNLLFGSGFNNQSKAKAGFLIGGGLGYHVSQNRIYSGSDIEKRHLRFTGVLLNAGLAFPFKKDGGGLMVRLSWMSRYPDFEKNVVGIGLIFW